MSWKQCAACAAWYDDAVYRSCCRNGCVNFTGTHNQPEIQVIYGMVPARAGHPAQRGVLRAVQPPVIPPAQHGMMMVMPAPQFGYAVLHGDAGSAGAAAGGGFGKALPPMMGLGGSAGAARAAAVVEAPDCVVCTDPGAGVTTDCGMHVCYKCINRNTSSLFLLSEARIRCGVCMNDINPAFYNGKVDPAVLDRLRATLKYMQAGGKAPTGGAEMSWNFSPPCPSCGAELGLDAGCDIVTCPKCKSQVNLATGSASKAALAHSFRLGEFINLLKGFDARSGGFVLKQCREKYADLWKTLKFDVLVAQLDAARGDQAAVTAILDKLVATEVQALKAYFLQLYLPPMAGGGTAAAAKK